MATTHRSELVDAVTNALMDEAYDGGMGPMSETEFPRHVRRLAETALEAVVPERAERPRVGSPVVFRAETDGPEFVVTPCSGKHRKLWLSRYVVLSCPKCNASLRKLADEESEDV